MVRFLQASGRINKNHVLKIIFHMNIRPKERKARKDIFRLKIHEMENWNFLVKFFFRHLSTLNIKRGFWLNNNVVSHNLYHEINSTRRLWKLLKMSQDERQASSWGITSIHIDLVCEWRHVMEINSPKVPLILNNKAKLNRRQFSRRQWKNLS